MPEDALTPDEVIPAAIHPDFTGPRLTPQKKAVALQLAAGRKPPEVCRRFQINTKTLANWQRDNLFQAELARLQAGQEEFVMKMNETFRGLGIASAANIADLINREMPTFDIVDPDTGIKGTDVVNMLRLMFDASKMALGTQGVSPVSKQHIKAQTTNLNVNATLADMAEKWQKEARRAKNS